MTEKQEKILNTALKLFAENGYDSTSTSKVAKAAGVSEGLIFRHYTNKEGLLSAIMEQGKQSALSMYKYILEQQDPKSVIRGIIKLPFTLSEEHYNFWKLLYALKWQADVYDHSISAPVKEALINAFTKLNAEDPDAEAEGVLLLIDGIATSVLLRKPENKQAILQTILKKYNV